ncbi:MAG: divalent-cation tolerance protein CutA [Syntrophales bacterium]
MRKFIQVFTTTERKEDAERIAQTLIEKNLAGCIQITGPITSIYRWKNKVERAEEWLCIIKSRQDIFADLEHAIREVHPYEVPEIVAIPITEGNTDYLSWLDEQLHG